MSIQVELLNLAPAAAEAVEKNTEAYGSERGRGLLRSNLTAPGIVAAIAAISLLHYGTSLHAILLHEIFKRLYYVPIVVAAVAYGARGGLATSILACLFYLPHIVLDWQGWSVFAVEQYGELIIFNVVAGLTGVLADRLRTERNRYREAAAELQKAYYHLKARTDERLRVDRLVTIGRIASGIAHEIRNPLGSLLGCVEILEADFPRSHPKREFFSIARKEMRRLDGVVTEFLELAEPAPPSSHPVDLNQIVLSASRLARPGLVDRAVTIHVQTSAAPVLVAADAEQVQRAVLNVILAGTSDARSIHIDVESGETGGAPSIRVRIPGAETVFAVADEFDPFPLSRRGHGLALATARRLIENQHGTLRAERVAGALEFVMQLPIAPPSVPEDPMATGMSQTKTAPL